MSDLGNLYQEVIVDHSRHPRNFHPMAEASAKAEGHNPLCGDRLTLYLKMDGGKILDVSFEGSGCAISTASASMLSEALKGKTKVAAEALISQFQGLVMGKEGTGELGKLKIFAGVREFPSRVKCATLSAHTAHAALQGVPVFTE